MANINNESLNERPTPKTTKEIAEMMARFDSSMARIDREMVRATQARSQEARDKRNASS